MRRCSSLSTAGVVGIVLLATSDCSQHGVPTPQKPPAPQIQWQGEDTGYQSTQPAPQTRQPDQSSARQ
jgi:hypothetical protein